MVGDIILLSLWHQLTDPILLSFSLFLQTVGIALCAKQGGEQQGNQPKKQGMGGVFH